MTPELLNAIVVVVVNVFGYAAVHREIVKLREQHKTVVEDHEHRITMLEKRSA